MRVVEIIGERASAGDMFALERTHLGGEVGDQGQYSEGLEGVPETAQRLLGILRSPEPAHPGRRTCSRSLAGMQSSMGWIARRWHAAQGPEHNEPA
eukprot:2670479-Pyramimonas_sp.AAC.1